MTGRFGTAMTVVMGNGCFNLGAAERLFGNQLDYAEQMETARYDRCVAVLFLLGEN